MRCCSVPVEHLGEGSPQRVVEDLALGTSSPLMRDASQGADAGFAVGHMGDITAYYDVKGMTCGACVATIEGALAKAPGSYSTSSKLSSGEVEKLMLGRVVSGVVTAKVALLSEKAEVLFDSQVTKASDLKDLIEAVGYDATLIKVWQLQGRRVKSPGAQSGASYSCGRPSERTG
jgi:copper chaperone CopZ